MDKKRVTFYVDGFNFYYGLKRMKHVDPKWHSYYWIDVVKLFEQFLGADQELAKVIYFTASPLDPDKSSVIKLENNAVKFANAIMPETVTDGVKTYTIPENWK